MRTEPKFRVKKEKTKGQKHIQKTRFMLKKKKTDWIGLNRLTLLGGAVRSFTESSCSPRPNLVAIHDHLENDCMISKLLKLRIIRSIPKHIVKDIANDKT